MSFVPGITAQHSTITPICRKNRGDEDAIDEALYRLRAEYLRLAQHWPVDGREVRFHAVLTVDYSREGADGEG